MKNVILSTLTATTMGLMLAAPSLHAATLDFSPFTIGSQGSTVMLLPEAKITSFGSDIFVGAAGISKEICALTGSFNCQADMEIDFTSAVNNLSFVTSGYQSGDSVNVEVYDSGGLIGSVVVASNGLVDLTAFANVDRIFMDDSSRAAGMAYDGFRFDVASVPEPVTFGLLGLGLAGLAASRRRNRAV